MLEARHTATCGADLFCFDVRGFGLSRSACPVDPGSHILTGLSDPHTSILRGAVALPTLGWLDGRRRLVTRGSGQEVNEHLARRPRLEAAAMATLRYFGFDERWTAAVAAPGARESIAR